jgi:trehalose 6-phosphate synthase
MVHDYHLYTLPELVRRARPDVFLHHFVHIPWTQPDAWRVLPTRIRQELYAGLLANDIIGFHTQAYRRNFLQCCRGAVGAESTRSAASSPGRARGVGARLSAADRPRRNARRRRERRASPEFEAELRGAAATSDPARRPRRPLQERAARLLGVRPVPRAAPRVLASA